jgi:hypothetical protein
LPAAPRRTSCDSARESMCPSRSETRRTPA